MKDNFFSDLVPSISHEIMYSFIFVRSFIFFFFFFYFFLLFLGSGEGKESAARERWA